MENKALLIVVAGIALLVVGFFVFRLRVSKNSETPPPVSSGETPPSATPQAGTPGAVPPSGVPSAPPLSGPFLRVVYPNGGERLCMDEGVVIRWKSLGIKSVGIFLRDTRDPNLKSDYPLGVYRADPSGTGTEGAGSTAWRVGFTSSGVRPPLGVSAYKILIKGDTGVAVLEDMSDRVFTIAEC